MKVLLPYGRERLGVELPDRNVHVVEPRQAPGLADEVAAVTAALRQPLGSRSLRDLVSPEDTVVIVVNDGTRPMPSARVLPPLLAELAQVPDEQITILVATGTHRANTPPELDEMLGAEITARYRVINHDARDPLQLRYLGLSSRGHPIWLNRLYLDATIKIVTGFIEPHFFAGFSGGPKPVMPGMAGLETIMANHGPAMIAHPRAAFGMLEGNPIHEEQREIALLSHPTFNLNVALNKDRRITGVWAGDLMASHAAGVAFVRETAQQTVPDLYDVVLTTNSGYPLDQNLYQSVKGMSAAVRVTRPGGAIVLCAACADGLPAGRYAALLRESADAASLLARVEAASPPLEDGWQAQIQAQILQRAEVYLYSTLADDQVRAAMLVPCHDVATQVRDLLAARGEDARLLVLPEGPQTIASAGSAVAR